MYVEQNELSSYFRKTKFKFPGYDQLESDWVKLLPPLQPYYVESLLPTKTGGQN